jgi:hypothetical protein
MKNRHCRTINQCDSCSNWPTPFAAIGAPGDLMATNCLTVRSAVDNAAEAADVDGRRGAANDGFGGVM